MNDLTTTPEPPPYLLAPPPMTSEEPALESVTKSTGATVVQLPGTKPAPTPRNAIDLERLELDYRAGKLTLKEMGKAHGNVSHARIAQIAKRHGWQRSINTQARLEANTILADPEKRAALTQAVTAKAATVAQEMAGVRSAHRELVLTARGVVRNLVAEVIGLSDPDMQERLEQALDDLAAAQREGDGAITVDAFQALVRAVNRATGTSSRAKVIKDLAMAAEKLITLERVAWDLNDPDDGLPVVPPDRSLSPAEHYRWLAAQRSAT